MHTSIAYSTVMMVVGTSGGTAECFETSTSLLIECMLGRFRDPRSKQGETAAFKQV